MVQTLNMVFFVVVVNIYILKLSLASCVVWIKSLVCFFLLKNRRFSLIANDPVIIDKALLRKATSNLGSASLITFTQRQPTRSKVRKNNGKTREKYQILIGYLKVTIHTGCDTCRVPLHLSILKF